MLVIQDMANRDWINWRYWSGWHVFVWGLGNLSWRRICIFGVLCRGVRAFESRQPWDKCEDTGVHHHSRATLARCWMLEWSTRWMKGRLTDEKYGSEGRLCVEQHARRAQWEGLGYAVELLVIGWVEVKISTYIRLFLTGLEVFNELRHLLVELCDFLDDLLRLHYRHS